MLRFLYCVRQAVPKWPSNIIQEFSKPHSDHCLGLLSIPPVRSTLPYPTAYSTSNWIRSPLFKARLSDQTVRLTTGEPFPLQL